MVLEWNCKIVTEGLHPFVTFANPFAAQLADQFRILVKPIREDSTANAFPRFEYCDIPTWFVVFECVSRRESRETCADDDAGVRATLDVGAEQKRNPDRRESRMF